MPCSIVFILDTSGSMSTKFHNSLSYFEIAKNYIENFIKGRARNDVRQFARDPSIGREGDRYYLLTTSGEFPKNIKSFGERVNGSILEDVKRIPYPSGSHNIQTAILDAFRLMHAYRTMTGIDGYGNGRAPGNTEPVQIILLTDGTGVRGIPKDMKFEFESTVLGSEMTKEAFRWDQKFFCIVFRIPSTPYRPLPAQLTSIDIDTPNIERLCAATGGRSFSIISLRQLTTTMDMIFNVMNAHRIGVRFDCLNTITGKQTSENLQKLRNRFKRLLEKRPVTNLISRITPQGRAINCHWQIPENYYPDKSMEVLPPRTAHPVIYLGPEAVPLNVRNDLPFDKLEIEPGGVVEIVQEMLAGRRDYAVPAYMPNSVNGGGNFPFGCLRLTTLGNGVNLILMPFNFPVFYQLIDELKDPSVSVNPQWRSRLDAYLQSIPFYCLTTTRQALEKFKVKVDVSSSMSSTYPAVLLNYLNRLKTKGKEEVERFTVVARIEEKRLNELYNGLIKIEKITARTNIIGLNQLEGVSEPEETTTTTTKESKTDKNELQFPLYAPDVVGPQRDEIYRNPWCCSVEDLTRNLKKMQKNIELVHDSSRRTLLDMAKLDGRPPNFNLLDELHNLPIKLMGEYEVYLQAQYKFYGPPFRKIEEEKERTHAFGNPYKFRSLGTVDEVSMDSMDDNKKDGKREGDGSRAGGGPPKRKRGPLGIDAFERWRTRRSLIGSETTSTSSDIEAVLSSPPSTPSTSNGVGENGLVVNDGKEIAELVEMMEPKEEKVNIPAPQVNGNGSRKSSVTMKNKCKLDEEIYQKKFRIMEEVRRPGNRKCFETIVDIMHGMDRRSTECLIRFAIRESSRFKVKWLTQKLEQKLRTVL